MAEPQGVPNLHTACATDAAETGVGRQESKTFQQVWSIFTKHAPRMQHIV
jgi:hypothetical protein